jgi:uncharacterized membrane protein
MALRFARIIIVTLVAVFIAQGFLAYTELPERIAVHFTMDGMPDRFLAKDSYIVSNSVVAIFVSILFLGIPLLLDRMPPTVLNIPNSNYWLAQNRKKQTLYILKQMFHGFGCATLVLMIILQHIVQSANRLPIIQITTRIETMVLCYLVILLGALIIFHRYFSKKEK